MSRQNLFMLYLESRLWTTYDCSSTIKKGNEMMVKSADGVSECRNVVYQFGSSCRQCSIKKDLEDAITNACTLQNRSEESLGKQLQNLFKKIETLEKGIDEKFQKMEALENITVRDLGKMEVLEKSIEDKLDKIAQRISAGLCSCNVTCPKDYVYFQADRFCYKLHSACKTWSEARDACIQEGGDLISLTTSNFDIFNEIAKSKAGGCYNSYVWVGATDIGSAGSWYWLNGEKLNTVFWSPGEPTGPNEHCAHFNFWRYKLNDFACSTTSNFLCQIKV